MLDESSNHVRGYFVEFPSTSDARKIPDGVRAYAVVKGLGCVGLSFRNCLDLVTDRGWFFTYDPSQRKPDRTPVTADEMAERVCKLEGRLSNTGLNWSRFDVVSALNSASLKLPEE